MEVTAPSQDLGGVGSGSGRSRGHGDNRGGRELGWCGSCFKCTWQVHPRSDFSEAPWSIMPKKAELKRRDFREARNFRRHFRIPYEFFLELVQLAKHRTWSSLAARDVAGRQCIPVELKASRSCCQFCQKCDVVWV